MLINMLKTAYYYIVFLGATYAGIELADTPVELLLVGAAYYTLLIVVPQAAFADKGGYSEYNGK